MMETNGTAPASAHNQYINVLLFLIEYEYEFRYTICHIFRPWTHEVETFVKHTSEKRNEINKYGVMCRARKLMEYLTIN